MVSDKQAAEYAIQAFMLGVETGLSTVQCDLHEARDWIDTADETIDAIRDNIGDYLDVLEAGAGKTEDGKETASEDG